MAAPQLPEGFDVNDPDLYAVRLPRAEFDELRKTAPIWWQSQPRGRDGFDDEGHWVLTRHAEVKEVSRNDAIFSSYENTAIIRFSEAMTRDNIEMQRVILLNMDAPQHTRMRAIISRGFTPRSVSNLKDALAARAMNIVQTALDSGEGDFVRDVACELPLQAIAELLGVPQEDRMKLFDWSNMMVSYDDPDFDPEDGQTASFEMLSYFMEVAEERKDNPQNDIVTKLVTADIDGQELTSDEFGFFYDPALGRRQRDDSKCNQPRHDRLHGAPGPVGALQEGAPRDDCRRDRPLVHAGRHLPAHGQGRHRTERRPADQAPATASACTTQRPTSIPTSSRIRTPSTSPATRTRTSASVAPAPTTALVPTSPAWR